MPDAFQELHQALRSGAHERNERIRRFAEKVVAIAPHPASPTREVLARLGDRWSSLLLSVLATGSYRHNELHRVVNIIARLAGDSPISQRMLTLQLRVLERDDLVHRSIGTGNVAAVEYSVTALGASLEEKLRALVDWATQHTDTMHSARQAFDQRNTLPGDTLRHRLR